MATDSPPTSLASRDTQLSDAREKAALSAVPDLDGRRFCRACEKVLPVADFPIGKRRYFCRHCSWLRTKKPYKDRIRADPHKQLAWKLWKRCWTDAKTIFGQSHVAVKQGDIVELLERVPEQRVASEIAILPKDPTQPVSPENLVLVSMPARQAMLQMYRGGRVEGFKEEIKKYI